MSEVVDSEADTATRLGLVQRAVEAWRKQLVDLTGRNRLIYYRTLKAGTLDLDEFEPDVVDALYRGSEVRLSDLVEPTADEQVLADAQRRAKSINATGRANFEERGINTLYAASGLATWDAGDTSKATPNAPVLLAPIEIHQLGGRRSDYTFRLVGPWEINQTLLLFWAETFAVEIGDGDIDELVVASQADHLAITHGLEDRVARLGKITDLSFRPGHFVGNFSYTKLPMVRDLQQNVKALAANDLIAAIAGDETAVTSVRAGNAPGEVSKRLPDIIPLNHEHLILDADSSQSHVINTVLAGKSLIVEGPPGTGKSQTIANLIACLAAEGKTALFVAEKRAAIEAVLKRLENVGLDVLALDLHSSTIKKRDTARALANGLTMFAEISRPDVAAGQAELNVVRDRVVGYERELHTKREPWGVSSFEVNTQLLAVPPGTPSVSLDAKVVDAMSPQHRSQCGDLLERWAATLATIDRSSPWFNAAIPSLAVAEQVIQVVRRLAQSHLPWLNQAVTSLAASGAAPNPTSLASLERLCSVSHSIGEVGRTFQPEVWQQDLPALVDVLSQGVLGRLGSDYRGAKKVVRQHRVGSVKRKPAIEILSGAASTKHDWHQLVGPAQPHVPSVVSDLDKVLQQCRNGLLSIAAILPADIGEQPLDLVLGRLEQLLQSEDQAILVGQLHDYRTALSNQGLAPLVGAVERGEISIDQVGGAFEASYLNGVERAIDARNPTLNTFQSDQQTDHATRFAYHDGWHRDSAAQRVLRRVAERATEVRNRYPDQSALIEREAKKKTRHRSLRQLQAEAGEVLAALRPCWIMSPLMVAQALPPVRCFDYVVFDEASQIRPEEAISAILRGTEVVVAGDRRQLPPSAFFSGSNRGSDELGDYDEDEGDALTAGYESILDVTSAVLPGRMLKWHYRSRDERLIQLSNDHIYERMLTTFPGTQRDTPVTFHKVDHTPVSNTEVRSNPTEIAKVVELMIDHARRRPDETLGVIAFGQVHAGAIEEALHRELAAIASPDLDEFFDENKPDRVFVKNIERVQGDERDAIILSVGYGRDLSGKVPHRFGPVNQEGGERRLNVAASRSRNRMMVVSSITHADLNTDNLKKGPQLLADLLRFASSGGSDTGAAPDLHPLNPFELAVKGELERLGLRPLCQYGSANYRIDFVLAHPANDGRMVLAVEADGASYHSSPTARDRDRLRQEILEGLGWKFHRIWSTAFFRDPRGEAAKVETAFRHAVAEVDAAAAEPVAPTEPKPPMRPVASQTSTSAVRFPKPVLQVGLPIDMHDPQSLFALARWVTDDGHSLLTDDQIKERMKAELGYRRLGAKISAAFGRAIDETKRGGPRVPS